MITLDTSGLLALVRPQDRYHPACVAILRGEVGPYIIPASILAEVTWMLETSTNRTVEQSFLDDLQTGRYEVHWDLGEIRRIKRLIDKYHDLPLGFADAAVVACAERNRGRVLTVDFRHFPVVARGEGTIEVLPEELPGRH